MINDVPVYIYIYNYIIMYVCFPFYLGDFQHFMGSSDFQSGGTLKSCPFTAAKWQATSPGLSKKDGSPIRFRCFCSNRKQVLYFCKGNNARMKPSYVNSKWCLWWFIGTPYYPFGTLFEGPGIGHDVSSLTRKTSIYMLGIQSASFVPSISKYQQILCIYDHCSNLFYLTRKTTEKQSETEKKTPLIQLAFILLHNIVRLLRLTKRNALRLTQKCQTFFEPLALHGFSSTTFPSPVVPCLFPPNSLEKISASHGSTKEIKATRPWPWQLMFMQERW